MLQKISSLFWRNQLVRFTCSVQVITLGNIDGSAPLFPPSFPFFPLLAVLYPPFWPRGFDIELFRSMHTEFLFCMRVRYRDVALLSWFSLSFVPVIEMLFVLISLCKRFNFNYITEWGDTRNHVFIKHIKAMTHDATSLMRLVAEKF